MGATTNNDTAVQGDTQYNLDQVMEVLFTGEAFAADETMPPVAFNPFNMFIQCFYQIDINIGDWRDVQPPEEFRGHSSAPPGGRQEAEQPPYPAPHSCGKR